MEHEVNCEIARGIISQYLAILAKQLAKEKQEEFLNVILIQELELKIKQLHEEQFSLWLNYELIEKVFRVYSKIVKDEK